LKATLATKAMAFMQKEAAKEVSKIMKRKRAKQK
jgi:hypothetical protein